MSLFLHVLKRMVIVVAAYLVATLAGLVALVSLYAILSSLPGAPEYFSWVSAGSILVLLAPPVALLVYLIALSVTAIPMLASAAITEGFALRAVWLHMILASLVGLSGFIMLAPTLDETVSHSDLADLGIVAAAGAVSGVVYWLIAGRNAGFRRSQPPSPLPSPV